MITMQFALGFLFGVQFMRFLFLYMEWREDHSEKTLEEYLEWRKAYVAEREKKWEQ